MGLPTHFLKRLNMREQLVREVEIIPLEVVVRNIAAGSLSKRLGLEEGQALPRSIIEFYYKNDTLGDPMVSEEHITAFNWATPQEIDDMMHLAIRINDFLTGLFLGIGIKLVDFKIEFGRLYENDMVRIVPPMKSALTAAPLGRQDQRKLDRTASAGIWRPGSHQKCAPRHPRNRTARTPKPRLEERLTMKADQSHPEERPDPQGKAIEGVRPWLPASSMPQQIFEIDSPNRRPKQAKPRPCEKLIANTVIENYDIELTRTQVPVILAKAGNHLPVFARR
jgi:hypothetical protein